MQPEPITVDDTTPIHIFWHIFLDALHFHKGCNIINRQFAKLESSGLLERCQQVFICYVSRLPFPNFSILNHPKIKMLKHYEAGFEGVTSREIKEFCRDHKECVILYIHNRSITHPENSPSDDWTKMMEFFVLEKWKSSIQLLQTKFTAGCECWSHPSRVDVNHPNPHEQVFHYSGNFWWARATYIDLLPFPDFSNRFTQSEDWILSLADHGIDHHHFGILHRTSLEPYQPGMVHSYIDMYPSLYYAQGNETPDIPLDPTQFHGVKP